MLKSGLQSLVLYKDVIVSACARRLGSRAGRHKDRKGGKRVSATKWEEGFRERGGVGGLLAVGGGGLQNASRQEAEAKNLYVASTTSTTSLV